MLKNSWNKRKILWKSSTRRKPQENFIKTERSSSSNKAYRSHPTSAILKLHSHPRKRTGETNTAWRNFRPRNIRKSSLLSLPVKIHRGIFQCAPARYSLAASGAAIVIRRIFALPLAPVSLSPSSATIALTKRGEDGSAPRGDFLSTPLCGILEFSKSTPRRSRCSWVGERKSC